MRKFLILGLPRSRTLWLSNFMTYGGSFCYHEGIAYAKDYQGYLASFENEAYICMGDANTAGILFADKPDFRDIPKVVIHRPIDQIIPELHKMFDCPDNLEDSLEKQQAFLMMQPGLHLDFNEIDNNLKEIWDFCTGLPFDEKRAHELKNMNIQIKDLSFLLDMPLVKSLSGELNRAKS